MHTIMREVYGHHEQRLTVLHCLYKMVDPNVGIPAFAFRLLLPALNHISQQLKHFLLVHSLHIKPFSDLGRLQLRDSSIPG
jgi:hypothetical protein